MHSRNGLRVKRVTDLNVEIAGIERRWRFAVIVAFADRDELIAKFTSMAIAGRRSGLCA